MTSRMTRIPLHPTTPIREDTQSFAKKGDAKAFFKEILASYRNGQRVSEKDALDLHALLKHHTEYSEKIGAGIDHFKVDINTEYQQTTRSFWIVRKDGSVDDFSYMHCITPKK